MKSLLVKKINEISVSAKCLAQVLNDNDIDWNTIDNVCWKDSYPYLPSVKFRIAHNEKAILVNFMVKEKAVRAMAGEDNGNVWEDSCCEFFFSPLGDSFYYNIETNCSGKILFASGDSRHNRQRYSLDFVSKIDRYSSLGNDVYGERLGDYEWNLSLVIPKEMFKSINNLSGLRSHANFYKCGDKLSEPHFLSWNKIETETPDFHRPDYFGEIVFE